MSGVCLCGCATAIRGGRLFIHGHNARRRRPHNFGATDLTRYSIEDRGYSSPCWLWNSQVSPTGYGRVRYCGRNVGAHKASFIEAGGVIPDGHVIDHLCRVRHCVNPAHMEAVTSAENTRRGMAPTANNARKTHCKHGHLFSPENTIRVGEKGRCCRICKANASREREKTRVRSRAKAVPA